MVCMNTPQPVRADAQAPLGCILSPPRISYFCKKPGSFRCRRRCQKPPSGCWGCLLPLGCHVPRLSAAEQGAMCVLARECTHISVSISVTLPVSSCGCVQPRTTTVTTWVIPAVPLLICEPPPATQWLSGSSPSTCAAGQSPGNDSASWSPVARGPMPLVLQTPPVPKYPGATPFSSHVSLLGFDHSSFLFKMLE